MRSTILCDHGQSHNAERRQCKETISVLLGTMVYNQGLVCTYLAERHGRAEAVHPFAELRNDLRIGL